MKNSLYIAGNTLCVQPPDETLDDTSSPILPTVQQQWPVMHERPPQISTRMQQPQQHHQCPPHFVQIPNMEMVRTSEREQEKAKIIHIFPFLTFPHGCAADFLRTTLRYRCVLSRGRQKIRRALDDWLGVAMLPVDALHPVDLLGRAVQISLSREAHSLPGALLQSPLRGLHHPRCGWS